MACNCHSITVILWNEIIIPYGNKQVEYEFTGCRLFGNLTGEYGAGHSYEINNGGC